MTAWELPGNDTTAAGMALHKEPGGGMAGADDGSASL